MCFDSGKVYAVTIFGTQNAGRSLECHGTFEKLPTLSGMLVFCKREEPVAVDTNTIAKDQHCRQRWAADWYGPSHCRCVSRVRCSGEQHTVVCGADGRWDHAPSDCTATRQLWLWQRHSELPAAINAQHCQWFGIVVRCLQRKHDACRDASKHSHMKEEFQAGNDSRLQLFKYSSFFRPLFCLDCFSYPSRVERISQLLCTTQCKGLPTSDPRVLFLLLRPLSMHNVLISSCHLSSLWAKQYLL